MNQGIYSIITGTGSYIPAEIIPNEYFLKQDFYEDKKKIEAPNEEIIRKFEEITGIKERRYVLNNQVTSDIAYEAAKDCLESSQTDKESLDYIIVANNYGDVRAGTTIPDLVPSLASRVKNKLEIENPKTIAYDIVFGCPGWLQGVIQADYYIKSGDAQKILVIGAETLSRIKDSYDRDSMIFADGAGAALIEARYNRSIVPGIRTIEEPVGILSHASRTDSSIACLIKMYKSLNPEYKNNDLFLRMDGHEVFEYGVKTVRYVVKEALDKAGLSITDVNKVLLHQANERMDRKMLEWIYKSYGIKDVPEYAMPMTISWLGNSSVATLPTMLDLMLKGKLDNHNIKKNDIILFGSIGAGMNINAVVYKNA